MTWKGGGGCNLAAFLVEMKTFLFILFVFLVTGCASRRQVVERRSLDSVAVVARTATAITGRTHETEFVKEIIIMERDTASGVMVETRREIIRTHGRETVADTMATGTRQTAVVNVSAENNRVTHETTGTAATGAKTRFWRIFGIVVIILAATIIILLFLYVKFWRKWIFKN